MSHKLTDSMNLDVFFHPYNKNGQVFTITNDPNCCGLDIPIKEFQANILNQVKKAKSSHTLNDGLRLSLTLIDPKYRESVSILMSNKKEWVHSDICGNHILHFFEQVLVDSFENPEDYRPPPTMKRVIQ